MELGTAIFAQFVVFAAMCAAPLLGFGIKLTPAPVRSGYVRRQLGER
jgi:hypothetical protein